MEDLSPPQGIKKIVLTGGPGAGKTTAADLLRREIGSQLAIVPEAATMIFAGGFPRSNNPHIRKATQETIYHIQKNLEFIQSETFPHRTLLCDRGTLDSAVYWPDGKDEFFLSMGTTEEKELQRYDAVIFFESAAVGHKEVIEGGNPHRIETISEAIAIDSSLKALWSQHHNYYHIPNNQSFMKKINVAIDCILKIIDS